MASKSEGGGKDELNFIKDKFTTREGTYILVHWSEYTKPTRLQTTGSTNTPVRASFINVGGDPSPERICFNIGKELYVYIYKGVKKAADLTKPLDRRVYKATLPTCHDFNKILVSKDSLRLLVGFSHGQIQVTDPMRKEISGDPLKRELNKFFNEEKLIDKSKVTCIRWIPGQLNHFLVSYASGQLYVYNDELPCGPVPPSYQPFKQGDGYSIHTCKTKSTRNPLYRWVIGQGAINEFAFSPCSRYLAVVSQDGFLRVFHYDSMELVGSMRSYFGGLLCVCWSPDSKFLVCGGEDDLVTVYSFIEKRVVCRGQGHRSWVSVVAFDPYTSVFSSDNSELRNGTKVQDVQGTVANGNQSNHQKPPAEISQTPLQSSGSCVTTYRFGSVGQDTFMCLWDLTEDVIQQPMNTRTRTSILLSNPNSVSATLPRCNNVQKTNSLVGHNDISIDGNAHPVGNSVMGNSTHHFATLSLGERKEITEKKEHKRNFSLSSKSSEKNNMLKSNHVKHIDESIKVLGTCSCPRLDEVPLLEPIVCEKISSERLTELVFHEDCIVTACQEGIVNTWARPGKLALTQHRAVNPQTSTGETYPVQ